MTLGTTASTGSSVTEPDDVRTATEPGGLHRLRAALVDSPGSWGARRRQERWDTFTRTFPDFTQMSVLDLGGTVEAWRRVPERPRAVTVLNLEAAGPQDVPGVTFVRGDACDPPDAVTSGAFDLVYSNAVIEHVGGYANRARFAQVARSLGRAYWVQTPYRYFPIEPHWLFPGFQFLPLSARVPITQHWPLLHTPTKNRERALQVALEVELVGRTEFAHLFPDAMILRERFAGLTKSLVAVRTSP